MAATVAMGYVGALSHFLWRSKIASLSPSWEGGDRPLASLACQEGPCFCSLSPLCSLTAFALCSSIWRCTVWLQAAEEQTSSRTKQKVCSHANLINNGERVKRNAKYKWYFLLGREGTYCTTAKKEHEKWSLSVFTSLPCKTKFSYFTVTATFSQAVGWQTLTNKQRNPLYIEIFTISASFFFFYFSSKSPIFFLTAGSPENSNSCWNDKAFSQVKRMWPI